MKIASEAGTGEDSRRQLVSPLELTLDAAVASERHRPALARRASADRADRLARATPRPADPALAVGNGADTTRPRRPHPPGRSPAGAPAARTQAEPLRQRPASDAAGWGGVCCVALGLLAVLMAFRLPVSPTSSARALSGELGDPTTSTRAAPAAVAGAAVAGAAVAGAAVAGAEPQQVDADLPSRSSLLRPSDARDGAAQRATLEPEAAHAPGGEAEPSSLDSEAHRAGSVSAFPDRRQPSSSALAVQPAQAEAGRVVAEKRAHVVTVDDLFGVGGNEPVPPEALDAPIAAAPPPSRTGKPAGGPPAASSLFYQRSPF
jgi:hypothetical protein